MAIFVGTIQEFHHFLGPKIRNAVNLLTRGHRLQRNGICEECSQSRELHSAHVRGSGRRYIIESVLLQHTNAIGIISCSIEQVEDEIVQAHQPVEQTFRFLCHSCHVRYDGEGRNEGENGIVEDGQVMIDGNFKKLARIELWAKRPNQYNHKIVRAFLSLERNGRVEYSAFKRYCAENLKVPGFDGHYASMKTYAGNSHGKVFYNEGSQVRMWDRVRKDVDKYFARI